MAIARLLYIDKTVLSCTFKAWLMSMRPLVCVWVRTRAFDGRASFDIVRNILLFSESISF